MIEGKHTLLRAIEKKDLKILMKWRNNPIFRVFFREHREINFHNQITWFNEFVKKKSHGCNFAPISKSSREKLLFHINFNLTQGKFHSLKITAVTFFLTNYFDRSKIAKSTYLQPKIKICY